MADCFVRNPKASARVPIQSKASVDQYFSSVSGSERVTFDDIRAHFGKSAKEWPDGAVHQLLIDHGYGDQVEVV